MIRTVAQWLAVANWHGAALLSMIYVSDLVRWFDRRRPQGVGKPHAYYFAHPSPASWDEFGNVAARIMRRRLRILAIPPAIAHGIGFASSVGDAWQTWDPVPRQIYRSLLPGVGLRLAPGPQRTGFSRVYKSGRWFAAHAQLVPREQVG